MIVAVEAADGRSWRVVDQSDKRELGVYCSRATAVRQAENDGAPYTPEVIDPDSRRRS